MTTLFEDFHVQVVGEWKLVVVVEQLDGLGYVGSFDERNRVALISEANWRKCSLTRGASSSASSAMYLPFAVV